MNARPQFQPWEQCSRRGTDVRTINPRLLHDEYSEGPRPEKLNDLFIPFNMVSKFDGPYRQIDTDLRLLADIPPEELLGQRPP